MLAIVHQDAHLVAIDKPAGLLVHRSPIDRHETRFAVQMLRDQLGRRVQPVHRLDKGTSGVLLFAFDAQTTRQLGEQFEHQRVQKHYLAVVRGWPPASGIIDHPLTPEPDPRTGREHAPAQPARTRFTRLATIELPHAVDRYPGTRYALLALDPQTGRRHQLRRHLKHIAHPIIGDATHGKGVHNRFFQAHFDCHRLLLACTRLRLVHPASGEVLTLRAPIGDAFARTVAQLGWSQAAESAWR